ncbi:bifunctional protein-serine/threonine kinase/phosphatase [methane-oxidizing endosymbiont of Gigantopelta aegis]|uniref:bifunctional protein-serine/threonine kinase/phosphatase n=1 Tax=methane-oxidizing endosymbiont of Gigantopelta aegis TaxID=2794938 RepID=UPI0018DBE9AF|nr:bifunctional protein-serine/threonine kinase/phosphatase [methane-oxidizing endosymbiont of Gigantopelta aegis]
MDTRLKVSTGVYSDKGIKADNEDSYGSKIPDEPQLTHKGLAVVIADGMSGCEDGKQASQCCVVSFLSDYYSTPDTWTVKNAGQKILSATNSWLYSQGHRHFESNKGLVSTLSILVCKSTTGHIFHIGDSRIYRLRKGNLELMTRDHRVNLSQEKSYLTRAMGIEPRLEVDYKSFPLEIGDLFIMTTDGVHDFISEKALKKCVQEIDDLDACCQKLVDMASKNNSDDNLTCQILKVEQLPLAKEDEIMRRHANLPFPPPLEVGMVLDGYRIEDELQASTRTQIYLAFDTQTEQRVILKTPSVLYEDDTHYIEHFLHEEWAGKRIRHDNVLKVLSSDRKKSCIYYVTEYIEGETLREWMDKNPKPEIRTVRKIVEQIAKGLRAFHRMEMLHQDLKPENIMLDKNGRVKIIDFGSVKIAGITELTPLEAKDENVLGTLNYTAPEYHLGQRGTVKSDIYSLGVITYEMLNNALPFGRDIPEKPDKVKLSKLRYVPSFHKNSMVPQWIDGALKKATAISPQLRYEELSEFLHDLKKPNQEFLKSADTLPLIERNPLRFWKGVSAILLLLNIFLAYLLFVR